MSEKEESGDVGVTARLLDAGEKRINVTPGDVAKNKETVKQIKIVEKESEYPMIGISNTCRRKFNTRPQKAHVQQKLELLLEKCF